MISFVKCAVWWCCQLLRLSNLGDINIQHWWNDIDRQNRNTKRKPVPVPLGVPRILPTRALDWTWASAVRDRWLSYGKARSVVNSVVSSCSLALNMICFLIFVQLAFLYRRVPEELIYPSVWNARIQIAFIHSVVQSAWLSIVHLNKALHIRKSACSRRWVTWHAKGVASWGLKTRHIFSYITPRNTTFQWMCVSIKSEAEWQLATCRTHRDSEVIYVIKKKEICLMCVFVLKTFLSVLVNQTVTFSRYKK